VKDEPKPQHEITALQEFGNNYQINGLVSTPLHYQHGNGLINYEIMRYDTATDTRVDHNNSVFLY